MAIPRIILGNKDLPTESTIASNDNAVGSPARIKYYLTISKDQAAGWRIGHEVHFRQSSSGDPEERIVLATGFDEIKGPWVDVYPNIPGQLTLNTNFFPIIVENNSLSSKGTAGLFVSAPGIDVTDNEIAHSGNLIFDSSTYVESSMFVVQQGSAILAGYKHRRDPVFHAGNRTNVSIDFSASKTPGTENIIPMVMLQFAVCNSSGHFHPNYADSANSQILKYMDSVWIKQLNVIGGTINTEHQSLKFIDDYIQQGKVQKNPDGTITDVFKYGNMAAISGEDEGQDSSGPDYPGSEFPHGTIHGMSFGVGTGEIVGEDLTGAPETHQLGDHYGKHPWAAINSRSKPNNYPRTQWETLVRPDGWHVNLNLDRSNLNAFTPQSYAQMDAPFGSIDRRIDKSINKTQYKTPGRTGYWKQKTWGLIYYVDNDKLIIQAWNDKSTSNAMISTNNANAHYNAWNTGKGDRGRIIASDYSGDGSAGSGEYPNHGLNIMDASTAHDDGPFTGEWPTRHYKEHTGHGAFNHDLALQENSSEFPAGAGSSIFDYYHDPNFVGSYNQGGNYMWTLYGRDKYYLPRSGWAGARNGMQLDNEAPSDVRYWPPEHRIMLEEYLKTGSYNYRGISTVPIKMPMSSMFGFARGSARNATSTASRWPSTSPRSDIPSVNVSDIYNFFPPGPESWDFPIGTPSGGGTGGTVLSFISGSGNPHNDPTWIGQYGNGGAEMKYNRSSTASGQGDHPGVLNATPGGNLSSNFGHPEDNDGWKLGVNIDAPAGDSSGGWRTGGTEEGPNQSINPAEQEHMPRSYMGGWDNFLWDNVPLKNFFITQMWDSDTYTTQNTGNYSQISPWMTFSNCLQNMELWPNGYPLWYKASLEDTRHGYGSMWWFLKGELEGRNQPFNFQSYSASVASTESPRFEDVPSVSGGAYGAMTFDNQIQPTYPNKITGFDTPVGPGARINNTHDFRYRPWIEIDSKRTGYLSYREAIVPNTEVTTISTNHFNPMDKVDGEGAPYPDPLEWDYFFVSYIVFNQGTGIVHDPATPQTATGTLGAFETDEAGVTTARPNWPIDPWTGQPLHD